MGDVGLVSAELLARSLTLSLSLSAALKTFQMWKFEVWKPVLFIALGVMRVLVESETHASLVSHYHNSRQLSWQQHQLEHMHAAAAKHTLSGRHGTCGAESKFTVGKLMGFQVFCRPSKVNYGKE